MARGNFQKKKAQKGREGPSVNSQAASPAPAPPGPWPMPLTIAMALSAAAPPPTEQGTGRGPAPEAWARVDNQGKSKTCTPHALSKGITDACEDLGVDVCQGAVTSALVNSCDMSKGKYANEFHGTRIMIKNKKSDDWFYLTVKVNKCTVDEFSDQKSGYGKKTGRFLLDYFLDSNNKQSAHCVYAKKYIKGKVHCFNSWGDKNKHPQIKDENVTQMSVVLHADNGDFHAMTKIPDQELANSMVLPNQPPTPGMPSEKVTESKPKAKSGGYFNKGLSFVTGAVKSSWQNLITF